VPKDRPDRPDSVQISRKFVDALSNIRDTMVRYDLAKMRARPHELVVELAGSSDECSQRFPVREGRTTIGRGESCDVHIEVGHVSRLHASIEVRDGEVAVKDEGSSNGTYVNGVRVSDAKLSDGDILHFGPLLRFVVVIRRPGVPQIPAAVRPELAETELPDDGAPPPPSATMELLDRERRQLAILLQVAMRYLSSPPEEDPIDVLFEVLGRVIQFDAAFVTAPAGATVEFFSHPDGVRLAHADLSKMARECEGVPLVRDSGIDGIVLSGFKVGSRVVVPLDDGGCIGLLAGDSDVYTHQLDFLMILSQIHSRAVRRG
jgi:hypothetical protein